MTNTSERSNQQQLLLIEELTEERARLARRNWSKNTLDAYSSDWKLFKLWCLERSFSLLPTDGETVALYLTDLLRGGARITTAKRRISAVNFYHRSAGYPLPSTETAWAVITGAQRERGEHPLGKRPLMVEQLKLALSHPIGGEELVQIRNRAIVLLGFTSALRRSNLAALETADVAFEDQGLLVSIRREKQDQTGKGRIVGIPRSSDTLVCPVRALRDWLERRGSWPGPIFTRIRHGRIIQHGLEPDRIAAVVKQAVAALDLDPRLYGAHSLRAGFITEALSSGAGEVRVAAHTGHRSLSSLRRYFRPTDPFRGNACGVLGL